MYKDGIITIDNFQKGMTKNSLLGYQKIANADIHANIGVIKTGFKYSFLSLESSVVKIDFNDNLVIGHALPNNAQGGLRIKYNNTYYQTLQTVIIKDFIYYGNTPKGYPAYIVSHSGKSNGYGGISWVIFNTDTKTWIDGDIINNILEQSSQNENIKLIQTSGSRVFYTQSKYIGSFIVNTLTDTQMSIASNTKETLKLLPYTATHLSILGSNLAISYKYGNEAGIIFWDKNSQVAEKSLLVRDGHIKDIIEYKNLLYYISGEKGRIYITDGTNIKVFAEIDDNLSKMQISGDDTIYVLGEKGIYEIGKDGSYTIKKSINIYTEAKIGAFYVDNNNFYWWNSEEQGKSNSGYLYMQSNNGNLIDETIIVTPIMHYGLLNKPINFSKIEFYFSKPYTGSEIKVSRVYYENGDFVTENPQTFKGEANNETDNRDQVDYEKTSIGVFTPLTHDLQHKSLSYGAFMIAIEGIEEIFKIIIR